MHDVTQRYHTSTTRRDVCCPGLAHLGRPRTRAHGGPNSAPLNPRTLCGHRFGGRRDVRRPGRRALGLMASGATCVQRLDGSRDSAIHTKYRISLRSSSMREPRYPLPRVVMFIKDAASPRNFTREREQGPLLLLEFLDAIRVGVCF